MEELGQTSRDSEDSEPMRNRSRDVCPNSPKSGKSILWFSVCSAVKKVVYNMDFFMAFFVKKLILQIIYLIDPAHRLRLDSASRPISISSHRIGCSAITGRNRKTRFGESAWCKPKIVRRQHVRFWWNQIGILMDSVAEAWRSHLSNTSRHIAGAWRSHLSNTSSPIRGHAQQHRDEHQRRDPLWTHCMDSFLPPWEPSSETLLGKIL